MVTPLLANLPAVPSYLAIALSVVVRLAAVAVAALPLNDAVIVPALKLPLASRLTIVLAVLEFVAVIQDGADEPLDCSTCPEVPAAVFANVVEAEA